MYELRKKCLDDYLNERVVGMYDTEYIQTASGELVLQRKKKMQTQNVAPPTLTTSNIDMFLKMLPSNKRKLKIDMENVEEEKNKKNEKKYKLVGFGLTISFMIVSILDSIFFFCIAITNFHKIH